MNFFLFIALSFLLMTTPSLCQFDFFKQVVQVPHTMWKAYSGMMDTNRKGVDNNGDSDFTTNWMAKIMNGNTHDFLQGAKKNDKIADQEMEKIPTKM